MSKHPSPLSYWQWPDKNNQQDFSAENDAIPRNSSMSHTFFTASLLRSRWGLRSSSRNSWFSPFRLVVKNLESLPVAFFIIALYYKWTSLESERWMKAYVMNEKKMYCLFVREYFKKWSYLKLSRNFLMLIKSYCKKKASDCLHHPNTDCPYF